MVTAVMTVKVELTVMAKEMETQRDLALAKGLAKAKAWELEKQTD